MCAVRMPSLATNHIVVSLLAIQSHSQVPWVGEGVSIALGNLALCDENRVAQAPGAVDAVASTFTLHGADPAVATATTVALRNMLRGVDSEEAASACAPAVVPLVRAAAMHSAVGGIVLAAMTALHCLSVSPSNCTAAVASGALPVVTAQLEAAAAALDGDSCSPALGLLKMNLDTLIRLALQVRCRCS